MPESKEQKDSIAQYHRLWNLARPYYEKGRPMDIAHIEWMMHVAVDICEQEGLDDSLLLPLCILHDVGYSQVPDIASANYYKIDTRKLHMSEGAKIADTLLQELNYPVDKRVKIVSYIAVHDNWAFVPDHDWQDHEDLLRFTKDPILGTFKDLDYLWPYSSEGFSLIQQARGMTDQQLFDDLASEQSPIYGKKPFSNDTTRKLHDTYMGLLIKRNPLGQ